MISVWWQRVQALTGRRGWGRLFITLATLLSVVLLVAGVLPNWEQLRAYDWRFEWGYLLLSAVAFSTSTLLAILGWIGIMRVLESPSGWRQDAKFFFYSWLNRRLPTPLPYVASRVLLYQEIGVPRRLTTLGLLWENILLVSSGALVVILLLPFTPVVADHINQGPLFVAVTLVALFFVARPQYVQRLVNWGLRRWNRQPVEQFLGQPVASLLLLIYVAVWCSGGLILFLLIRAIHPVPVTALGMVVQGWVASGLVGYLAFFTPGGLGVREITLASLLSTVLPLPVAVAAAVLTRLWTIVNEIAWAIIVWRL